uniref:J domain-containing protein n=1 Tax=Strongyloides venezuelensis TaxID=75913 RepID=A0A0K0F631_STRVS
MAKNLDSLYSLLGVTEDASISDIKKAYHLFLRANHPDKTGIQTNENLIEKGMFAWKQLGNADQRKIYDKFLQEQKLHALKNSCDSMVSSCQELDESDASLLKSEGYILIPCVRCDNDINLSVTDYLCIVKEAFFECSACSMLTKVIIYNDEGK